MAGPWLRLCFPLESLYFPLFLTTFSACWCHISLNFHLGFCVHHSDHILHSAGQFGGWPTHVPSPTGCGMWPPAWTPPVQAVLLVPLAVFASALVLSKSCPQALSLSFSLPPWLLLVSVPASMIPGAVAGLCPPPSLCTWPPCLGPSSSAAWTLWHPFPSPCVSYFPWECPTVQPKGVFWGHLLSMYQLRFFSCLGKLFS